MADLKDKLKDLLANPGLMKGSEWLKERERVEGQRRSGDFEIDKSVPGQVVGEEGDSFYLVRHDFPLQMKQGPLELGAVFDTAPEHVALSACDEGLRNFDPGTAIFMDTETTGLAGGTGTVAFLVGAGFFHEGKFRLEQCFMRDFDDEEPMLRYLDELFERAETVVSFNGKSFDVPLLRTRFISNRVPFRLDAAAHYDLVHAARRLWRLRLRDCSLGNIERKILGIRRKGDVPSAEIPQIWFDYLRTRDARDLQRVFYHHRMDILSLVTLTAMLSECLAVPAEDDVEFAQDRLSIVRLHFRQKRFADAAAHAGKLIEAETDPIVRRECLELLAYAQKRMQEWDRMADTWSLMLREFPSAILPRVELAKHHEHRTRNLAEAKRLCQDALQFLGTRAALDRANDFESVQAQQFQHRLDRIRRKRAKGAPPNSWDLPENGTAD